MTARLRTVRRPANGGRAAASDEIYVHPGELAASGNACTISTILGSCVGVCLFDPAAHVGGLNHFLLPVAPAHDQSPRFGDAAIARLIESLEGLGARRSRMVAKVIGGACVLEAYRGGPGHIGRQNVRAAMQALLEHRIVVTTMDVGGDRARKLRFRPDTGDLVVRTI